MRKSFGVAILAGALAMAGSAQAQTYSWTLSGPDSGSGTFITTSAAFGGLNIADFTGTIDGTAVAELGGNPGAPAFSPDGFFTYDNILFPSAPQYLDINGILMTYNGSEANLWGTAPGVYTFYAENGPTNITDVFTINFVPEPASLAVFAAGLAGLAFALRRNKFA